MRVPAEAKYLYLQPLGAEYTLKHLDHAKYHPPYSRVVHHVIKDCYTNTRRESHECFALRVRAETGTASPF